MTVSKPTYPNGVVNSDIEFDSLISEMDGKHVYIGSGKYTKDEADAAFADKATVAITLGNFDIAGELMESSWKTESSVKTYKTRNYIIAGRRTTTLEIGLAGMSDKQRLFFERSELNSTAMTFLVVSDELNKVICFSGLRWYCDWSGSNDNGFEVILKTEFSGYTTECIFAYSAIPDA